MHIRVYDRRGVGLRFENFPTDLPKYFTVLAEEGCHPKAAQRILDRISEKGFDMLTVTSTLNFDYIIQELATIGVTVTFIPPLENWEPKYHDGEWPEEALPERF